MIIRMLTVNTVERPQPTFRNSFHFVPLWLKCIYISAWSAPCWPLLPHCAALASSGNWATWIKATCRSMKCGPLCIQTADDKPVMKAVIGTTFQVCGARLGLVSLPPSGPSPKSFPNVRKIKTKHGERNTTLQSSDFWWAISAPDSSLRGGGPYLALNMKQAASLGNMGLEPLKVHRYSNTQDLLCLEKLHKRRTSAHNLHSYNTHTHTYMLKYTHPIPDTHPAYSPLIPLPAPIK